MDTELIEEIIVTAEDIITVYKEDAVTEYEARKKGLEHSIKRLEEDHKARMEYIDGTQDALKLMREAAQGMAGEEKVS